MRYLFGFLCVCALGVMPLVGCSEAAQCQSDKDCDDENACTDDGCNAGSCDYIPNDARCDFDDLEDFYDGLDGICISGVCEENPCDDGNECTYDSPPADDGSCLAGPPCSGCRPCDWNGVPGVCIDGVCEEDPCLDVVCDDGDLCTVDVCSYLDGKCSFSPRCHDQQCQYGWCDPADGSCTYTPKPNGTPCIVAGSFAGTCESGACVSSFP